MASFKISMKPNERIYINGAVIRFDRKTSLEFLNDVHFLLESHVMQAADADTPLKRLYFIVQAKLMAPQNGPVTNEMFDEQLTELLSTFDDSTIVHELKNIDRLVKETRFHEAMKTLRSLFPIEKAMLDSFKTSFPFEVVDTETSKPILETAG